MLNDSEHIRHELRPDKLVGRSQYLQGQVLSFFKGILIAIPIRARRQPSGDKLLYDSG